jgi:tetratricopeptide (TPR) repeat protein
MRWAAVLVCLLDWNVRAAGLVDEGRALYDANRLVEARAIFERALRVNPAEVQARFWLAFTCVGLDDLESALRNFEKVESAMGRDQKYLYAVSETYTRRARQLANHLVELGDVSRAHQHLAYRYTNTGDWKTAVDELRVAALLRPKLAGVHLDAAEILWDQKQYDEAATELRAELAIHPLDFLANLRYGQYLARVERCSDAVAPLETAVRYRKYPEAVLLLAFSLDHLQKPERAMAVLNGGLAAFPANAGIDGMRRELIGPHPELAQVKALFLPSPLHETAPGIARLRAALDRNPKDEDALFLLRQLYSDRAAMFYQRLEESAPDSVRVLQIKGLNAESTGDLARAEVLYRQVLEKQPRLAGAHYALGHLLRQLGKDDEALQEFQREIEIDSRHYLAYFDLGATYLQKGEAGTALPMLAKSVDVRPSFIESKVELAKVYIQLKRPAEAIPLLKAAINSEPNHPTAHYLLSRAYIMTGAAEQGRQEAAIHQEILGKQTTLRRSLTQRQHESAAKPK